MQEQGNLFDYIDVPQAIEVKPPRVDYKEKKSDLSPEEIQRKQNRLNKTKSKNKENKALNIVKMPISGRHIKSLGDLRKRIAKFFDEDYIPTENEPQSRETVNDLAMWLGYGGATSLINAIKKNRDSQYTEFLSAAVDKILTEREETAWNICVKKKATRDIVEMIKYNNQKYNMQQDDSKTDINININAKTNIIRESVYKAMEAIDIFESGENELIENDRISKALPSEI